MGIRISNWKLAREVSGRGELGVISGTAMDNILVRSLQSGDGDILRALRHFPDQDMVQRVLDRYYIPGGKQENKPFKSLPMWTLTPSQALLEVTVLANFAEVWLAKHNDDGTPTGGLVGINLLTKVQLPTLPSLYGAMLADVDYVIMGAGIPMAIPGFLDRLAQGESCSMSLDVEGRLPAGMAATFHFNPAEFWANAGKPALCTPLQRPSFVPIVSSVVLAQSMLKRATGAGPTRGIQGFVIELPTAGGHNAPPRGSLQLNERGEPIYGPKDQVDLLQFQKATEGLPFWLAGSCAHPDKLHQVLEMGGQGIQVGTAFALANESGMMDHVRQSTLQHLMNDNDKLQVFTDPQASPTGFPFKVLSIPATLSDAAVYEQRPRVCNLGYLRTPFVTEQGKIDFRCAAEPVDAYIKKGGTVEATEGRKCLCNALCADAGYPQLSHKKKKEPPLVTMGDDVTFCRRFVKQDESSGQWGYSANDVLDYLLEEFEACARDSACL
jgi:nitronate monooxygenase